MHRFNAFSHSNCASHTLSKNTSHKFFPSNMICSWSLIHRKFKSVLYPIAAESCVSRVKSCIRNSQIPYLKANSIFKKSFVSGSCTRKVPIATKVVCFSRLRLNGKQCERRADCFYRSSLFWVHHFCLYA